LHYASRSPAPLDYRELTLPPSAYPGGALGIPPRRTYGWITTVCARPPVCAVPVHSGPIDASFAPGRNESARDWQESTMDVTKILEADHRLVEDLFRRIERAEGNDRRPLLDQLVPALRGHMELEEKVVYPAMERVTGHEPVEEGNKEHELARKGLVDLVDLAPDEPGFGAALDSVKAGIEHHVEEEEGEVFPKLRKEGGSVLGDMATPFMQKRLELGLPMEADALAAASSKDELAAEAEQAGVEVKSSMTKQELAEALAAKMA
jgi:hemerythrin superfamily protein